MTDQTTSMGALMSMLAETTGFVFMSGVYGGSGPLLLFDVFFHDAAADHETVAVVIFAAAGVFVAPAVIAAFPAFLLLILVFASGQAGVEYCVRSALTGGFFSLRLLYLVSVAGLLGGGALRDAHASLFRCRGPEYIGDGFASGEKSNREESKRCGQVSHDGVQGR